MFDRIMRFAFLVFCAVLLVLGLIAMFLDRPLQDGDFQGLVLVALSIIAMNVDK